MHEMMQDGTSCWGTESYQAELVVVRPFPLARVVDPVPMVLVLLGLLLIPVL